TFNGCLRHGARQIFVHSRMATTTANSVKASMNARAISRAVRMSPAASGCRAMESIALEVAHAWLSAEAIAGSAMVAATANRAATVIRHSLLSPSARDEGVTKLVCAV